MSSFKKWNDITIEIVASHREGMLKWAVSAKAVAAEIILHKHFKLKIIAGFPNQDNI